jgi:hypothetical protein
VTVVAEDDVVVFEDLLGFLDGHPRLVALGGREESAIVF